ncbi:MAG TPA: ATP-dependent sacrificial sulfur transferase LarE [Thermomicrobiales bacterium]|nr:ATP-dependent sacrificial sulfur transferase LarE [Thermomicrobiales bacterium]
MTPELQARYEELRTHIAGLGSALVAFSGGVDSALVLRVAHDALGDRVAAGTGLSDTYPEEEMREAREIASEIGTEFIYARTMELTDPRYAANNSQRCFFCKTELYSRLAEIAQERGYEWLLDGTNADDLGDHRPGMRAARNWNVRSPLAELGFRKKEIRELSAGLNLRTWDKPSFACLSSRFAYGDPITVEKLKIVAKAETAMRELGFRGFRVRHHEMVARIELPEADFVRAMEMREEIVAAMREAGYAYAALDLAGFRSGSQNLMLRPKVVAASTAEG